MKLLLGSLTYPLANGVTNSINVTTDGLRAEGHDVRIVAPDYDTDRARPEHYPVPSSRISELASRQFGNGERFFSVRAIGEIQKLLQEFDPDIFWLHTVTWAPNIFEVMMQRTKKTKVLTYHTLVDYYAKIYAGKIGEQHMIGRSRDVAGLMDGVIAPSNFVRTKLENWGVRRPIAVIPTGIEPTKSGYTPKQLRVRYKIPHNHAVLLSVGRIVREKNIGALLRMLQHVTQVNKNVTLLLVGPGNIEDCHREARSLGIERHIVTTDQVPPAEARKMYWAADVFVFASQTETQGLVFGEAMSAGLPIAALDSPIRPEFYPESVAAVSKTEKVLGEHVVRLLGNRQQRQELTNAGRLFFQAELSAAAMTKKQLAFFKQLRGQ